jgi:hypothetical protein
VTQETAAPAPLDDVVRTIRSLFPEGPAWQTMDATVERDVSIMQQLIYAMGKVVYDFEYACYDTLSEFFCATTNDDLDAWFADYGLPDECDPFGTNLCAKVQFNGGVTLQYYENLIAELGWQADLRWLKGNDPEFPGVVSTLYVKIDLAASSGHLAWLDFSNWEIGIGALGEPDQTDLICALERAIPAHCAIMSEIV